MIQYPEIDPVAFALGPLKVHWYGISYLLAFAGCYWLLRVRAKQSTNHWQVKEVEDVIFYGALGVIIGGRLGYVLFYNFSQFLDNPVYLFQVWQGGMSFHGGLLGVLLAMWLYGRKTKRHFFQVTDFIAPVVPWGLACGRLGNFINAELWGRPTDLPWAMVFPTDPLALPRHPSMLYEMLLEGLLLLLILWFYSRRERPMMAVSGLFLLGYGVFRFSVEFVREPDAHIGFIAFDWLTMGMLLTLPMIMLGAGLMWWGYKHHQGNPQASH